MPDTTLRTKHFLFASDFDKTLSFNDSGLVLSELAGIPSHVFEQKIATLAGQNLVQQGGELAYLLLHDTEYRSQVRREHLVRAGKEVRLKKNIRQLSEILRDGIDGYRFEFHVISAAPQDVMQSALEGIIAPDHLHGTQLMYDDSGQVESVVRVNAGYGKVAVLDDLQRLLQLGPERIIYVGDGSSDLHVMLHVNHRDGFTIAVSEARDVAQIAKRTVLSDDALSVLIPTLEEIVGWDAGRIRAFFEGRGLLIQEWDRTRTDWLTITSNPAAENARLSDVAAS